MKYLFILINILGAYCFTQAQNTRSEITLDSLTLTTRNVQDESDLLPLPESHPDYKEPKVEVTIEFTVFKIESLKNIEINFEKEKGKKDFRVFKLDHVTAEGKSFLTIKNRFYEIKNSKVSITEQLPASILKRKIYFSVKAIDKSQRSSNVLTREFN